MEAAKKFYLVDERTYNSTKTVPWQQAFTEKFQEASWSKPADKRSKNTMHKDMHSLLESNELSDDIKAKLYNQSFIRVQNTNNGTEMQPVAVKQEPVREVVATKPTTTKRAKRTKRKRKFSKTKAKQSPTPVEWEDLPTSVPQEDDEDDEWETLANKKKKKVVRTAVRRSSRPKKVIKWDPIYDV